MTRAPTLTFVPSPDLLRTVTRKKPSTRWSMRDNQLYRDGKKVGALSKDGRFQVIVDGRRQSGSVTALLQQRVKAQLMSVKTTSGLSGKLRLSTDLLEVMSGTAFLKGRPVGSVEADGTYRLTVDGRTSSGNVFRTPGAVWLSGTGRRSGRITVAHRAFTAIEGAIYENGQMIGWLSDNGRFRGVTLEGDYFEGHLADPSKALYLRLKR